MERTVRREMRQGAGSVRPPSWRGGLGGCPRAVAVALMAIVPVAGGACGPSDAGDAAAARGGEGRADTAAAPVEPWTPELASELRDMGVEDQEVRAGFGPGSLADTAYMRRMVRTDSTLTRRLREMVGRHGWPGRSAVGAEAAQAAFLILQHTPDHEWQRAMLTRLEPLARTGELDPRDYALLHDRVQVRQGLPQRYGSQLSTGADGRLHVDPLEDTAAVDSLRAALGLQPLEAYFELVEQATGAEVAPLRPGPSGR